MLSSFAFDAGCAAVTASAGGSPAGVVEIGVDSLVRYLIVSRTEFSSFFKFSLGLPGAESENMSSMVKCGCWAATSCQNMKRKKWRVRT